MAKFATLRDQILNININGLELRVRADQIDFLFGDGDPIIRWCVNHMVSAFDRQRQVSWEAELPVLTGHNNQAKLPEGITLNMTVMLREEEDVMNWPSYMKKDAEATSWVVHGPDGDNFDPRTQKYPEY